MGENTSLKNTTPAGVSNTNTQMAIGKINTYQRSFLIVAGSLLALLAFIVVAGTIGGQHVQSSAHEDARGAVALVDYQGDTTNVALTKDIFGFNAVAENNEVCCSELGVCCSCNGCCSWCRKPCCLKQR